MRIIARKPGKDTVRIWAVDEDGCKLAETTVTVIVRISGTEIKSLSFPKKGQLKVGWKGAKGISGYELEVSESNNFKAGKQKTYKFSSGTKSVTVKGKFKAGKKYYVRVRTYKNGSKKLYSKWSFVKTVTVK